MGNLHRVKDQARYISASQPAGDIELLLTASPAQKNCIEESFQNAGLPLYWIGSVTDKPEIQIEMANGTIVPPAVQGFIHKLDGYKLFK